MLITLAAWLHDWDPFAIEFWQGSPLPGIRWYGLSYLAGFAAGFFIIRRLAQIGNSPLKPQQVLDLVMCIALGVLAGGRIGYVILYDPKLLTNFTTGFPFWGLLALNKGGMASHGGLIGIAVVALFYGRRHQISCLHLLDLATFTGPVGLFFGRVANFVNGELYGRICDESSPLAVKFPQEMYTAQWMAEHMHRVQPALARMIPTKSTSAGQIVDWAIIKIRNGNQQVTHLIEPLLPARHPSQLYEAVLEGLLLFLVLIVAWAKPRKPGVIFGLGCSVYGIVRIFAERYRQPDDHIAHLESATLNITRGQWLSGLLFIVAVFVVISCARRNVEPLGGWRTASDAKQTERATNEL